MPTGRKIFSGEPLPIPPAVENAELSAFHRKVIDYLRRLAGRIDSLIVPELDGGGDEVTGVGVLVYAAHKEDQGFEQDEDAIIIWENELRMDSAFTGTPDLNGNIVVTANGFYVVEVDVTIFKNTPATLVVRVNGNPTDYSFGEAYFQPAILFNTLHSMMVPLLLQADDRITVTIRTASAGSNIIQQLGSRILVSYYPEESEA